MYSVEDVKQLLSKQLKQYKDNTGESFVPTKGSMMETPEGIDLQVCEWVGKDTGILFYMDRSQMFDESIVSLDKTIEIKSMRFDLRGDEPRVLTRDEWLEIKKSTSSD